MTERVILVNEIDEAVGVEEKIRAHLTGALHRAFSIFVFNSNGQLLLQKRAASKYHSKGLWSNTCCGHPRPGESLEEASRRRLSEEMGFYCALSECLNFIYRVKLDNDLIEHEYDHVMVGRFDGDPEPSTDEVDNWKWVDVTTLKMEMRESPEKYTYWFLISFDEVLAHLNESNKV